MSRIASPAHETECFIVQALSGTSSIWELEPPPKKQKKEGKKTDDQFFGLVYRGLVGPARQFGPTGVYKYLMYAMLAGGIAPIPFWLWQRRFPDTRLKYINLPVMLNGPTLAPPANGINYVSWFIVGFIFRTSSSFHLCMQLCLILLLLLFSLFCLLLGRVAPG